MHQVSKLVFVTMVKLNGLCGRAMAYRRQLLAELGPDAFALRHDVRFSVPFRDLTRRPAGSLRPAWHSGSRSGGTA